MMGCEQRGKNKQEANTYSQITVIRNKSWKDFKNKLLYTK